MDGLAQDPDNGDLIVEARPLARLAALAVLQLIVAIAVIVAVALVLINAPVWLSRGTTGGPWNPATSGGGVEPSPLDLPLVPMAGAVVAFGLIVASRRFVLRQPLPRTRRLVLLALVAAELGVVVTGPFQNSDRLLDPTLIETPPSAAGPMVAEVRGDGRWVDVRRMSGAVQNDCPDSIECVGPRYLYRLHPGDAYTYLLSFQNRTSVPITVLGYTQRPGDGMVSHVTAIGLPRDPASPSADPASTVPFRPIVLAPGASVSVVVGETAGTCANPTAAIPPASGRDVPVAGLQVAYEVLGWHRSSWVYAPFMVTVAGEDCP